MATTRQVRTAKRNITKAQSAAQRKRTITHLPAATRRELGRQGAKARRRGAQPGRSLEERNRTQLYAIAQQRNIRGRSKMGKWDLIRAIRAGR